MKKLFYYIYSDSSPSLFQYHVGLWQSRTPVYSPQTNTANHSIIGQDPI